MKATGVVLSHSRISNIPIVVTSMLAQSFIDEVIVWDNNPSQRFNPPKWMSYTGRVEVIQSEENIYTLGRFRAAAKAKNEIIVTCDDDYLVMYWSQLWQAYWDHQGRPRGVLVSAMPSMGFTMALLGWGSVFDRSWAQKALDRYEKKYGQDEIYIKKADRIFTLQHQGQHIEIVNPVPLPGHNTKVALYRNHSHNALNHQVESKVSRL